MERHNREKGRLPQKELLHALSPTYWTEWKLTQMRAYKKNKQNTVDCFIQAHTQTQKTWFQVLYIIHTHILCDWDHHNLN